MIVNLEHLQRTWICLCVLLFYAFTIIFLQRLIRFWKIIFTYIRIGFSIISFHRYVLKWNPCTEFCKNVSAIDKGWLHALSEIVCELFLFLMKNGSISVFLVHCNFNIVVSIILYNNCFLFYAIKYIIVINIAFARHFLLLPNNKSILDSIKVQLKNI